MSQTRNNPDNNIFLDNSDTWSLDSNQTNDYTNDQSFPDNSYSDYQADHTTNSDNWTNFDDNFSPFYNKDDFAQDTANCSSYGVETDHSNPWQASGKQ